MPKYIAHITFSLGLEVVHIGAYEVEVDSRQELIEKKDTVISSICNDLDTREVLHPGQYDKIDVDFQSV